MTRVVVLVARWKVVKMGVVNSTVQRPLKWLKEEITLSIVVAVVAARITLARLVVVESVVMATAA